MVTTVNQILYFLTVAGSAFVVVLLLLLLVDKENKLLSKTAKRAYMCAFIVALTATGGSLFYSEIAGYEPCKLCWYQRIFMYPQVALLGLALFKKERTLTPYILTLSVIGGLIALYHYFMQMGWVPTSACSVVGYSASCSQRFVLGYGYITIPMMALTAFALNGVLMVVSRIYKKKDIAAS